MTPEEARAAGALAGRAVMGAAEVVEHTHRAVAGWTLDRLGLASVVRSPGLISTAVYATVRAGGALVGLTAGHAFATTIDPTSPPVGATTRGSKVQAALNGAVGDSLDDAGSALTVRMSLRRGGHDVPCESEALRQSFPDATSRVVVFVHGLCHDENAWTPPVDDSTGAEGPSYADLLSRESSATPVLLRYNTGRHVSDNGAEFSDLLAQLAAAWPVPILDLVLVGHSMGGLVIRSACAEGERANEDWIDSTRLIVTLGTPHTGAPLERLAAATGRLLDRAEPTRGVARIFHARSSGIKDLRRGYISEQEWADCEQDSCPHDHRLPAPPVTGADHLVVAATLTANPWHPVGRVVGDILVRPDSAHGLHANGLDIGFPGDAQRVIGGVTHIGLLHDPAVYEQLRSAIATSCDGPAPESASR